MLSQYNILTNAQQVLRVYHHQPEDISLALLPLSHAYQQTVGLILPLIVGSPIVFLTKFASDALTDALKKYEIRTMLVVPRVLTHIQSGVLKKVRSHKARRCSIACVRALRFLPLSLRRILFISVHRRLGRHLTNLVVGGAPLPLELDQFFQGLGYRVYVGYGVSECSPVVCVSLDQQRAAGEIGRPLPGVELTLNEKSELLITGENVFLGYWPSLTRPAIFNTEDVAEVDSNGSYILKGRTKNLFVDSNGYKIFFEDIEQIVAKMPDVEDCCVVSVPADDGAQLCCAVKGSTLGRGHEASLRSQINTHLPYGIRLARVIIVEPADFPYTHTLKTNRHKVQELCMV
jgi:long-chain acyl-CoA synthetase